MLKRALLSAAAVALAATAAFALDSGLKPGASVPAFDVVDVSGPNKGKQLCYRCSYGGAPVVAAFIKKPSAESAQVVSAVQKLVDQHKGSNLRAFVVFMGGNELKGDIAKIAAEKKVSVPLTFLPQGASASDVAQYKISKEAENTILLWNKGVVRSNHVNVDKDGWAAVEKSAAEMLK
ncbi:MAG: hypothetical protein ACK47B_06255 [Armatimonadota bacterium]